MPTKNTKNTKAKKAKTEEAKPKKATKTMIDRLRALAVNGDLFIPLDSKGEKVLEAITLNQLLQASAGIEPCHVEAVWRLEGKGGSWLYERRFKGGPQMKRIKLRTPIEGVVVSFPSGDDTEDTDLW